MREPAARGADEGSERGRETRERLLDAAEALFAERGFEGTSVRAVTRAAGASVSAANYHFGSKEALLRATLLRRIEPVNRRRLARLDALERAAGEAPVALESVLDAFLRPVFEEWADSADRMRHVAARVYSDPPELVAQLKEELFGVVVERFTRALARALPGRDRAEIDLAFHFVVGAMVHVMSGHLIGEEAAGREGRAPSAERVLQRLVAFAAAGLRGGEAR